MRNILFYSDCFVYSGSENVVENILKSERVKEAYSMNFYYAYNKEYEKGIKRKFNNAPNIKALTQIANPYTKFGYRLKSGEKISTLYRYYLLIMYVCGTLLNKIGLLHLYNGYVLYKLFKREQPSILFINNGGYPAAESCRIAVISAHLAGIKNILFVVNNLAFPSRHFFDRILDKYINKYVTFFITASKAARERLVEIRHFDANKCINIPNTLLPEVEENATTHSNIIREEFDIDQQTILLGAVGLLTRRKGYHVLVEAMHQLTESIPNHHYKLIIIGEGEERSALESLIQRYNLQQVILLPGFRPNVIEYVKGLDVFVAPSIANEDFPYVIIEAMMLSKPVIGTRVAGIPEQVLDGQSGYIVPPDSANELAAAIRLIASENNIPQMGVKSQERYAAHFSNSIIMDRYLQLFSSLSGTIS